jgi:hypothetical protein
VVQVQVMMHEVIALMRNAQGLLHGACRMSALHVRLCQMAACQIVWCAVVCVRSCRYMTTPGTTRTCLLV